MKVTKEQKEEILYRLAEGERASDLARRFNVTRQRIAALKKEAAIETLPVYQQGLFEQENVLMQLHCTMWLISRNIVPNIPDMEAEKLQAYIRRLAVSCGLKI